MHCGVFNIYYPSVVLFLKVTVEMEVKKNKVGKF